MHYVALYALFTLTNEQTTIKFHIEIVYCWSHTFWETRMNKTELIGALSEETNFSKKDIAKVLSSFTRIVERTLKKGGKVSSAFSGADGIAQRGRTRRKMC